MIKKNFVDKNILLYKRISKIFYKFYHRIFVILFHIAEIIRSCFRPRQRLPRIVIKNLNFLLIYDK